LANTIWPFRTFALGRLVEYKGYEYLIKAAQFLDDSYCILIGGKGPLEPSLQGLIQELGLEKKVQLLGFLADQQVPNYFAACDLFCLSSIQKTEAFAIVQIEAMSCAKPIVSTDIPGSGVAWVNQHNTSGLLVPIESELAIAEAIQTIMTDASRYKQLAAGSKERFHTHFTRAVMVDKCLAIYQQVQ